MKPRALALATLLATPTANAEVIELVCVDIKDKTSIKLTVDTADKYVLIDNKQYRNPATIDKGTISFNSNASGVNYFIMINHNTGIMLVVHPTNGVDSRYKCENAKL